MTAWLATLRACNRHSFVRQRHCTVLASMHPRAKAVVEYWYD